MEFDDDDDDEGDDDDVNDDDEDDYQLDIVMSMNLLAIIGICRNQILDKATRLRNVGNASINQTMTMIAMTRMLMTMIVFISQKKLNWEDWQRTRMLMTMIVWKSLISECVKTSL